MWVCSGESRFSRRRSRGKLEEKSGSRTAAGGLWNQANDRQAGEKERDQGNNLDDLVCRNAKSAIMVWLTRSVRVSNLSDARDQHQGNAHDPDKGQWGESPIRS